MPLILGHDKTHPTWSPWSWQPAACSGRDQDTSRQNEQRRKGGGPGWEGSWETPWSWSNNWRHDWGIFVSYFCSCSYPDDNLNAESMCYYPGSFITVVVYIWLRKYLLKIINNKWWAPSTFKLEYFRGEGLWKIFQHKKIEISYLLVAMLCIDHIPYYLLGLTRVHFFWQPFSQ